MPERGSVKLNELVKQPSHLQIVCSACSLANWLKIAGAPVSEQVGEFLIQTVLERHAPIETQEKKNLAAAYGYDALPFVPKEEYADIGRMTEALSTQLASSPILLAISPLLSRRDRTVAGIATPADLHPGDKLVTHSVVMMQGTVPNEIDIIDPYDPIAPEVFDTGKPGERLRLCAWTLSAHYQWLIEQQGKKTKEELLEYALWELPQRERVKENDRMMFGLLQAEPLYLRQRPQ